MCAQTILEDLLTIRADRDVYYYGCDDLFTRHPEVIKRLCVSAPTLLPTLLDGLVWRSRQTKEGWMLRLAVDAFSMHFHVLYNVLCI